MNYLKNILPQNSIKFENNHISINNELIKNLSIGLIITYTGSFLYKKIIQKYKLRYWANIRAKYQKERQNRIIVLRQKINQIYEEENFDQQYVKQILNMSIQQLQDQLEQKKITSVQLLHIFIQRTLNIGVEYNLVTEFYYEKALKKAEECDYIRKNNPEQCKGELFGIPISIKDSLVWKDTITTLGITPRINIIEKEDGIILKLLQDAGAIPFVKSNIPQILLATFTQNYIYGISKNPWNKERTNGGSSGGEAGLVSSYCSPLGIGTDIGGSIRIPCTYTGLVGFKPGSHRLPSGMGSLARDITSKGNGTIETQIGPMSKYVSDNVKYMKIVLNKKNYSQISSSSLPTGFQVQQWDQEKFESKQKMTIGYYCDLKEQTMSVTVQRAIKIAIEKLEQQGHKIIKLNIDHYSYDVVETLLQLFAADGGQEIVNYMQGDQLLPYYDKFLFAYSLSGFSRFILVNILKLIGQSQLSKILQNSYKKNALQTKKLIGQTFEMQKKQLQMFTDNKLDAIISPVTQIAAPKHKNIQYLKNHANQAQFQNMSGFPSGTVPITLVQENEQHYDNSLDNELENKMIKQQQLDSKGMPVGIQITTLPYEEEKCLNLMQQLENSVQFWQNYGLKI